MSDSMPKNFGDLTIATRMREWVRQIVRQEIDALRPRYRYGTVQAVDTSTSTVEVSFPEGGDTISIPFKGAPVPKVGNQVRVSGLKNDRHVDQVLENRYYVSANSNGLPTFGVRSVNILRPDILGLADDFNSPLPSGQWEIPGVSTGVPNAPHTGANWWFLLQFTHGNSNEYITQIATELNPSTGSGGIFHRKKIAGTWTAWRKLTDAAV